MPGIVAGNYKDLGKRDRVIVIEHFHSENHRAQRIRVYSQSGVSQRTKGLNRGNKKWEVLENDASSDS